MRLQSAGIRRASDVVSSVRNDREPRPARTVIANRRSAMADASELIEQAPLQDRDLLLRLSLYFDAFEHRLRQGQGWFIFNAAGGRSHRIARFIQHRVADDYPEVTSFVVPWRDFALSAYVNEVGLPELAPQADRPSANPVAKREYQLAKHVTEDTWNRLLRSDLLVLIGLKPSHWHEAMFL